MFMLPPDRTVAPVWGGDTYKSAFASYASGETPQSWRNVLLWCQNIFANNGTISTAMARTISYFLTDIDVGALTAQDYMSDDDREKWIDLLKTLDVVGKHRDANMDEKCYGNYFMSLHVPFRRMLRCKKCGAIYPFVEFVENPRFSFRFASYEFHGKCPRSECKYSGPFEIWDEPKNTPDQLSLKLWSPLEIEIVHDLVSGDSEYIWRIPEDYKAEIRMGNPFQLERVPQQVLKAIKHNQLYRFNKNMIFHGKSYGPTGLRTRGWGFSPMLYCSRNVWYVELLHRYNEAIALDYVVPLRVITPDVKMYSGDQGFGKVNLDLQFKQEIAKMVKFHRRNPTSFHTLPFPINFQQFGGDASKLVPYELLNQGYDVLLNALGAPVELQRGTLQIQAMPTALRVFEAQHHHMVSQNNRNVNWIIERVCEVLNWEPVKGYYRRVQHADDLQRQLNILQMAMGGQVSQTEAMRTLGLEYRDQRRQIMEEARYDQELQARMQEEMDQTAYGQQIAKGMPQQPGGGQPQQGGQAGAPVGAPAQGPMPPGQSISALVPGPENPMTPEDMEAAADSAAQTLLGMPSSQRISELKALRTKNPVMHKMVKGKLEEIRSRARSQGGSMLLQQQFGGGQ